MPNHWTWHWEGAGGQADHAGCAAEVRSIQAYHFSKGYFDIAYHWIICQHGVIFQGRDADHFESAAQAGGNPSGIAVCFMWGPQFDLTDQAKSAAIYLAQQHPHAIIGHRDEPSCTTSCPGDNVEAFVHAAPALTAGQPVKVVQGGTPVPKPLPPAGITHPVLKFGTVGPAVMELQRKLDGGCGQHLAVDGEFGQLTHDAVVTCQHFFGLTVDGIVGPKTWAIIDYCAAMKGVH